MKKVKALFIMFAISLATLSVYSQETKWQQMEDFHAVMSVTFHPAEDGNLKPLKEKAGDLATNAKVWQKGAVPEGFNAGVTKPILKRLVKQCNAINKAVVAGKTDEELKKMIIEAHDIFHEIKEKCRNTDH